MPAGLFAFADLVHAANRRAGRMLFETDYVALQPGAIDCAHGMVLQATNSLQAAALDALLVPGFWAESAREVERTETDLAELVTALRTVAKGCQLWSYCTGVCLLASSGRLDGLHATVTWWLAELAVHRHGKVRWQSEQNCIVNERTATASGVNGYLPIAQALIERHVSPAVFHDLIRLMVLPRPLHAHSAFQSMSLIEQPSPLLRQLHAMVERLPAEQITMQQLAGKLGMSERTLARKVHSETGFTGAAYARRIKLNQVSERLILTSLPVSTISAELGFSSDSNMRRMFRELTLLTPAEYRQKFGRN